MLSFILLEWIVLGCTSDELSFYKHIFIHKHVKHKLVTKEINIYIYIYNSFHIDRPRMY